MKHRILSNDSYVKGSHLALLLLLTILCYWPLSFGIFSAKNDNIVQFLPVRFQVSEALRHGQLPLWSPYMYLGYPIHGDMQGGAWNPLVWLLSAFGRYNLTSLHVEILVYVFLGGAGMYRLLGVGRIEPRLRLAGAAAYLMCGYATDVGGSNAPFLAAIAFVPFVLAYYYRLLETGSMRYSLKAAVALALLFVSGYPSFFITTCYILLAGLAIFLLREVRYRRKIDMMRTVKVQLAFGLFFLGLCAPAIISYAQVLPFYQRGSGVGLAGALQNSFHPSCSLSFLLPTAPVKNAASFTTDLISRNAYFNSFFLLFALCYAGARKRLYLNFAAAGIIFFFLFSLGGATPLRAWCYKLLPLMDTFRHPSNARLFVTVSGIVLGAAVCQQWLKDRLPRRLPLYLSFVLMAVVLLMLAAWSNPTAFAAKLQILRSHDGGWRPALKNFFDRLTMGDLVLMNGIGQLVLLGFLAWALARRRKRWLPVLFVVNSFFFAQLALPYTLVSQVSPRVINGLLRSYPQGYPSPRMDQSIGAASTHALDHFDTLGISAFYQKEIETTPIAFTPTFMTPIENLYKRPDALSAVLANPWAYLSASLNGDSTTAAPVAGADGRLRLQKMSGNSFDFKTSTRINTVLCLEQLYLPGWQCTVDGKGVRPQRVNAAFMAVSLPTGEHRVVFDYRPRGVMPAFILSVLCVLFLIVVLIKSREKTLYR